jgi:hypothetical protein
MRATGKSERSEDGLGGWERGLISEVYKHVNLTISLKEVRALRYVVAASIILTYSCFRVRTVLDHCHRMVPRCASFAGLHIQVAWMINCFLSGWPDRR